MDEATREMIGCAYLALADATGLGVLETANRTIMAAVENGGVRDPIARQALTVLVQACQPDDSDSDAKDEMAGVEDAVHRLQLIAQLKTVAARLKGAVDALAAATGDASIGRLVAYIDRRASRFNASSSLEDILAIVDMVTALEGALKRGTAKAAATVDA